MEKNVKEMMRLTGAQKKALENFLRSYEELKDSGVLVVEGCCGEALYAVNAQGLHYSCTECDPDVSEENGWTCISEEQLAEYEIPFEAEFLLPSWDELYVK